MYVGYSMYVNNSYLIYIFQSTSDFFHYDNQQSSYCFEHCTSTKVIIIDIIIFGWIHFNRQHNKCQSSISVRRFLMINVRQLVFFYAINHALFILIHSAVWETLSTSFSSVWGNPPDIFYILQFGKPCPPRFLPVGTPYLLFFIFCCLGNPVHIVFLSV